MTSTKDFWEPAISRVLEAEGGWVCDPADPGGETNFGISKKSHPREDISALTAERAREIYRKEYWEPMRLSEIGSPAVLLVFEAAVMSGPWVGAMLLQKALVACGHRVLLDGRIGPATLQAANAAPPAALCAALSAAVRQRLLGLIAARPELGRFKKGWIDRVNKTEQRALALCVEMASGVANGTAKE